MRTIFVDIDNTICRTEGTDYANAQPMPERIAVVNRLYEAGDKVIIWTARGASLSARDDDGDWVWTPAWAALRVLTEQQLQAWGVRHHELWMDKPHFDVLVDDRAVSSLMEV